MNSDDHTGLPEPSRPMFPSGQAWYVKGPVGDVRAVPGSVVAFGLWEEQPFRIVATPEEAIELARTLAAAAHHARETTPQTIPIDLEKLKQLVDEMDQSITTGNGDLWDTGWNSATKTWRSNIQELLEEAQANPTLAPTD